MRTSSTTSHRRQSTREALTRALLLTVLVGVVLLEVAEAKKDFYQLLGVSKGSSKKEIDKAWRKTAKKLHPDKSKLPREEAEKLFSEASNAHDVLTDPEKKRIYDQTGQDPNDPKSRKPQPGGSPFGTHRRSSKTKGFNMHGAPGGFPGGGSPGGMPGGFESFFDMFGGGMPNMGGSGGAKPGGFGSRTARERAGPPPSSRSSKKHEVSVSLEDLYKGTAKRMTLSSGRTVTVPITPGVQDGDTVTAGGYEFVIKQTPHSKYTRKGNDLFYTAEISLTEALTGTRVRVPFIDGGYDTVVIDKVVNPKSWKKLVGQGMPKKENRSQRGNLIVQFDIIFPKELSDSQKGLIRQAKLPKH